MAGPAATVSSNHICPMCSGLVPHVGGPITQGEPTVLIEGKPAATIGSICTCVGPPDIIVTGVSNVFFGGKPAATMGSMTAHGGSVVMGAGTVLIGTGSSAPTSIMPITKIPFSKTTTIDRIKAALIGETKNLRIAEENQAEIRELAEQQEQEPQIIDIQFINENDVVLSQSSIKGIEGGNATDFIYGKKIKIKVITKNIENGKKIKCKLKGKTKNTNQKFLGISQLDWELEINNDECETILFPLPISWYSEVFENYNSHKTIIKSEDLNAFMVDTMYEGAITFIHKKEHWLKPIAYRRNYEEYIGLYKYEDLTIKHSEKRDSVDNYENKYISKNSEIRTLVKDFLEFLNQEDLKIEGDENKGIKERIEKDAKRLWLLGVKQVQDGDLDDRTLYWARNKMQVHLKRHPLFEKDINFEKSTVNTNNTPLNDIIILFEELSRNYNNISFSGITSKKLLITGFDPFILDPTKDGNPLQSNPSGVTALDLHGKTIGDYYIQTFIAPVRYKDFDEFKEGEGIIEKFITPFIKKVNMIITVSQGGAFRFDVDRFPAKNRGGYKDNMLWGTGTDDNKTPFKQLTIDGEEFYKTTLPYKKIVPDVNNPSDTFWVYFNQTFKANGKIYVRKDIQGTKLIEEVSDSTSQNNGIINDFKELQSLKSVSGSGSNYLSNEIYYRVARLRTDIKSTLHTGHLHIPLTQYGISFPDSRGNIVTIDINPKMEELIDKIKEIITKI